MNGLLTALLGGTQGLGQGLQQHDEREMRLRAEKMSRLSMAVEMAKSGVTPPKELLDGFDMGDDPTPQAPSAAVAPPVAAAPPPPRGTLTKLLPQWAGQPPQNATPAPTQPGGMSGTSAIQSAARNVGGFKMDVTKSFPYQMAVGVEGAKRQQDWDLKRQEMVVKAQDLMRAGAKNPDGTPMSAEQALAVASNGEMAFQHAPILGSDAYNRAKAGEASAVAPVDIGKAVSIARQTAPIEVGKAVGIAQATAPIEVKKATQIAAATEPIHVAGQKDVQRAGQDFQREQQARGEAGSFLNQIGLEQYRQGAQVMPNIIRGLKGSTAPIVPPSNAVNPVPVSNSEAAWAEKNPPMRGETFEQYHARFLNSGGK